MRNMQSNKCTAVPARHTYMTVVDLSHRKISDMIEPMSDGMNMVKIHATNSPKTEAMIRPGRCSHVRLRYMLTIKPKTDFPEIIRKRANPPKIYRNNFMGVTVWVASPGCGPDDTVRILRQVTDCRCRYSYSWQPMLLP